MRVGNLQKDGENLTTEAVVYEIVAAEGGSVTYETGLVLDNVLTSEPEGSEETVVESVSEVLTDVLGDTNE